MTAMVGTFVLERLVIMSRYVSVNTDKQETHVAVEFKVYLGGIYPNIDTFTMTLLHDVSDCHGGGRIRSPDLQTIYQDWRCRLQVVQSQGSVVHGRDRQRFPSVESSQKRVAVHCWKRGQEM